MTAMTEDEKVGELMRWFISHGVTLRILPDKHSSGSIVDSVSNKSRSAYGESLALALEGFKANVVRDGFVKEVG